MGIDEAHADFRRRLRKGEPVVGIFVKTASHQVFEILAGAGVDYVVIDAEHAPYDRNMLDACLMAARAGGLPCIVRIPELSEAAVLSPLDMGAAGVMVPHVRTRSEAAAAVRLAKYAQGRGFSNSPRAGHYGRVGLADHVKTADDTTTVVAMIEDPVAIANLADIAAVDGIDALFMGRADLAVSLGETDTRAPAVVAEVAKVLAAAPTLGKTIGALAPTAELAELSAAGVRMFLVGTDQALLRAAVGNAAAAARDIVG